MSAVEPTILEPFLVPFDGQAEILRAVIEPVVAAEGFELVVLQFVRGHGSDMVRLSVDKPGAGVTPGQGIVIADLEHLSRLVGDLLDVEDTQHGLFGSRYELEVGSPGVDRPLTKKSHFALVLGSRVKAKSRLAVQGARSHAGVLSAVDDAGIDIQADGGAVVRLAFGEIVAAHVVYVFEAASVPKPKRQKQSQRKGPHAAPAKPKAAPQPS